MTRDKRPRCERCLKRVVKVSVHGLCPACSARAVTRSVESMRTKQGRPYRKWLKSRKRAAARLLSGDEGGA